MQTKEELATQYLAQLKIHSSEIKNLVIGLIGLPGTGKSTVAAKIAEQTGILVVSNDNIRRFLNTHGHPGSRPDREVLEYIAVERTKFLFEKGISHIIDADLTSHVEKARNNATGFGFKLVLIKVECPEDIALARIEKRLGEGTDESQASIKTYHKRVEFQEEHATEHYDLLATINTAEELLKQVESVSQKLRNIERGTL
jgi:predicted kinase